MAGSPSANAAKVKSATLNLSSSDEIVVIAEDGANYSKLESSDLTFAGNVSVRMKFGRVKRVSIALGTCGGSLCGQGGFPKLFDRDVPGAYGSRKFDKDISFTVPTDQFPQGLSNNVEAANIFHACAQRSGQTLGSNDVTFTHNVKVTLGLDLSEGNFMVFGFDPFEHTTHDSVPITVRCKALKRSPVAGDFQNDPGEFKVKDIKLALSTFPSAVSHPNPATVCKKGWVNVKLTATKAGATQFRLWTKIGGAAATSKVVLAWASHDGNGKFKAEHSEWVSVSQTSTLQAKTEEMINGVALATPWKSVSLQCQGAGSSGGFSQDMSDYESTATLAIFAAGGNKCPRPGQIGYTLNANYSEAIKVRVTCNNGIDQTSWVQMAKNGAKWKGTGTILFPVKQTHGMGCVIRQIRNGKATIKATATKQLDCRNHVTGTGSTDLAPVRDEPEVPGSRYKLTGDFSYIDHGSPKCKRTGKALINFKVNKIGPVYYRLFCKKGFFSGVAQTIPHPQGGYIAPALKNFTITKTTRYYCELWAGPQHAKYKYKFGTKRHLFECRTPTTDPGPGNKTTPPRPVTGLTVTSGGIKVAPPVKDQPTCKNGWRTTCKREPHRTCKKSFVSTCKRVPKNDCRNVTKTQCRRIAKPTCRNVVTRSCSRRPKRVCHTVRGRQVCRVKWTNSCKRNLKRECKRTFVKNCQRVVKRECKRAMVNACRRTPKTTCNVEWRRSCKRVRATNCRR